MSTACQEIHTFYRICGHDKTEHIHHQACQETHPPMSQHLPHEINCSSPNPILRIRKYKNDRCGLSNCRDIDNIHPQEVIERAAETAREEVEAFEREHPEVMAREEKEHAKEVLCNKIQYLLMPIILPQRWYIMDLKADRKDILPEICEPVEPRVDDEDDICIICRDHLQNSQIDNEGKDIVMHGEGIACQLPCQHRFHVECIVTNFAANVVNKCPTCRQGTWVIYILNGFEPPTYRWIPTKNRNVQIDGYLEKGAVYPIGRGNIALRPFRRVDRWGEDNNVAELAEEENINPISINPTAVAAIQSGEGDEDDRPPLPSNHSPN